MPFIELPFPGGILENSTFTKVSIFHDTITFRGNIRTPYRVGPSLLFPFLSSFIELYKTGQDDIEISPTYHFDLLLNIQSE
ncbi:hypothetical protein DPH57_24560 [Massilia sp. YMA4]|nr:hypothetical protein DPH57_24560 [Massilia sp. YMA4]